MTNKTSSDISANLAKAAGFFEFMESAGGDPAKIMQSAEKMTNLAEFLSAGCPSIDYSSGARVTGFSRRKLAEYILGRDFILPEEAEKAFGWKYSPKQMQAFRKNLPNEKTLKLLRGSHILVPGPTRKLRLTDIAERSNSFVDFRYVEQRPEDAFVEPGFWLAVRKGAYSPVNDPSVKHEK